MGGVNGITEREESSGSRDTSRAELENNPGREACDPRADKENSTASRVPGGMWLLKVRDCICSQNHWLRGRVGGQRVKSGKGAPPKFVHESSFSFSFHDALDNGVHEGEYWKEKHAIKVCRDAQKLLFW
ncbi:hypothetical protein NDU88_001850 [Pleurodeles waltl]|uniref:Uncharacterized protein n=1 Tax=Pleurodeles waltl TaxID=8319 RepID=A0AAV7SB90_PLEWA|nr:hypothetical protein NDU88_001850 [Pleurodeles waltl]